MPPWRTAIFLTGCLALLPVLFDRSGAFRFVSEPTALDVMKGVSEEIAPQEPRQVRLRGDDAFVLQRGDYTLTATDRFELQAVVLGRRDYTHDREADLSPMDLVLGWAAMSNPARLADVSIRQSDRFYHYRVSEGADIRLNEVSGYSSNMHMIPADEAIGETLRQVREGDVVVLDGHLVDIHASDGWRWRTSRSRVDTGSGACEIFFVESAVIMTFGDDT